MMLLDDRSSNFNASSTFRIPSLAVLNVDLHDSLSWHSINLVVKRSQLVLQVVELELVLADLVQLSLRRTTLYIIVKKT